MRPKNIDRLPKWAKSYTETLERDNRYIRQQLDVLREGREPGPIRLGQVASSMLDGPGRNEPFYMPGHDVQIVHAGVKLDVSCAMGTDRYEPELRLYFEPVDHLASHQAVIVPQSSNAVKLAPLPRSVYQPVTTSRLS